MADNDQQADVDKRWRALARGELSEDEVAALLEEAERSDAGIALFELYRPLDADERERVSERLGTRLREEGQPPGGGGRASRRRGEGAGPDNVTVVVPRSTDRRVSPPPPPMSRASATIARVLFAFLAAAQAIRQNRARVAGGGSR